MTPIAPKRVAILAALATLPLLAACGGGSSLANRPQAPCPRVALLADAVDLTRYRPGAAPDIGTVEVDARMNGFQAKCDYAPRNAGLDVTLTVQLTAERGPASSSRTVDLPYLVAVVERDESRVLNRGTDTVRVTFAGNQRSTGVSGEEMLVRIPGDVRQAADRTILIGFALTPEQLEANRRRGAR